jgi:hypothetical protein
MKLASTLVIAALCSLHAYSQTLVATDPSGKPMSVKVPAMSLGKLHQFFLTGTIKELQEASIVLQAPDFGADRKIAIGPKTRIVEAQNGISWADFRKTLKAGDVITVSSADPDGNALLKRGTQTYGATSIRRGYITNDETGTPRDDLGNKIDDIFTAAQGKANKAPADVGSQPGHWPPMKGTLAGKKEVRVRNPNEFSVKVGLRGLGSNEGKGKDFTVPKGGTTSVFVPGGSYDIYFQYSTDPDGLYQGDRFSIDADGVEIKIVKVVNGNFGIRKVN